MTGDHIQGNLQNLTVEQYKDYTVEVFEYLYEEYGIVADLDNIRFSSMEINCTFPLVHEFYKYHRVLRLMMFNLPQSFQKMGQVQQVNKKQIRLETETFYRANSSTGIKIYDKGKQLKDTQKAVPSEPIMRMEFTLKTSQKIKEAFGSNLVRDLSDDKINEFFYRQFRKLFENRYRKWQLQNGERLRKMMLRHKKEHKRKWQDNFLTECSSLEQQTQVPVLLGLEELLPHIKAFDQYGHCTRIYKSLVRRCESDSVYLQKDGEKAEEIIQQIHAAYLEYCQRRKQNTEGFPPPSGEAA